jgi:hypothetical protein
MVRRDFETHDLEDALAMLKDAQLVTPEDIRAGWRVLSPEQAAAIRDEVKSLRERVIERAMEQRERDGLGFAVERSEALVLLAGVPGKDSDT